ncbi:MAG: AAA family ATPase [Gracilimonas sp.]
MRIKSINIQSFKGLDEISLNDLGDINAVVGKNNSGKSSILHAIDMASLALAINNWNRFQPKLAIQDLFNDVGNFSINITYENDSQIQIQTNENHNPIKNPNPEEDQKFTSILIWPDVAAGMKNRHRQTPKNIIQHVENRNFGEVDSLEILSAIKYYAQRNRRGLSERDYEELIEEVRFYFPDIDDVESDRTEDLEPSLTYEEYGRRLDILYSGSGLKHFLDVLVKTTISGADIILIDEPEMGLHPDLQRRFISYLHKMVEEKGVQIFLATHSQVLLNYADTLNYYRIRNSAGSRSIVSVPDDAIHTLLSDLGLRPSDVFNQDICLMVEGASEIVFFEHIIRNLYEEEFEKIGVGILQYGGSAADGIISGSIDVSNIVPAQEYTFWIRDRDSRPDEIPSTNSTQFQNALNRQNLECYIWGKREIEFYYPENILIAAQQGDQEKEEQVIEILNGDQDEKFRDAAEPLEICVPQGKYLKRLLDRHLNNRDQLDPEIRNIIEETLIIWKDQILGN